MDQKVPGSILTDTNTSFDTLCCQGHNSVSEMERNLLYQFTQPCSRTLTLFSLFKSALQEEVTEGNAHLCTRANTAALIGRGLLQYYPAPSSCSEGAREDERGRTQGGAI